MTVHIDVFRPRMQPHRSIYDAFQDEALKRLGRSFEEWVLAEKAAVYQAALRASADAGFRLQAPTMEMVESAEISARGSVDYGLTWVCHLLRSMQKNDHQDHPHSPSRSL